MALQSSRIAGLVCAGLYCCCSYDEIQIAPVAISEWDSWGWLNPALSWLGGAP